MKTKYNTLFIIIIAIIIYLLLYLLFKDGLLYIIGGAISVLFKLLNTRNNILVFILIWIGILTVTIITFLKTNNHYIKNLFLLLIVPLMYVVDLIDSKIIKYDELSISRIINVSSIIIIKGIFLAFIFTLGNIRRNKKPISNKTK